MTVGTGKYRYKTVEGWGSGPDGPTFGGVIPALAVDSDDRVYLLRRKPAAVMLDDQSPR